MIKLTKKELTLLRTLIGDKIISIESTDFVIYKNSITSYYSDFLLRFEKNILHIENNTEGLSYFENEDGNMFYDYNITINSRDMEDVSLLKDVFYFSSSKIIQIEVYGRHFNPKDFIQIPKIYNQVQDENQTDDLFIFTFKDNNKLILSLDNFMPQYNIYFDLEKINFYSSNFREIYKLHYRFH